MWGVREEATSDVSILDKRDGIHAPEDYWLLGITVAGGKVPTYYLCSRDLRSAERTTWTQPCPL